MYVFQRSLLYYPQPREVTAAESTMRLPVDGAELIITARPHEGRKAIVYFGGNGEDVSRNLESYTTAFPDHALYLMHYRGYGGSTGTPTEKDIVADATVLIEKVRTMHPDIALVGRSLGTGVAIQAATRSIASRMVLITPFDSIVEIGQRLYPWLPVRLLALDTFESGQFAQRIQIPTTIIAAEHDNDIPRASTEMLLGRFRPGVATMTIIEGVGHNDIGRSPIFLDTLQAALK
jgi:pimeloyl-ACP methyl ester carboxylesterase